MHSCALSDGLKQLTEFANANNQPSYPNVTDVDCYTVCVNKVYEQLCWLLTGEKLQSLLAVR